MYFNQNPYECKMEWGRRGAREAADRGDIVIIVDVLSFSSTVVSALNKGAIIYPYPPNLDGKQYAESIGAEFILGRAEAARLDKPTLSPVSFNQEHNRKKYVITSLNGSFCTWIASKVPALLVGSLLNARSVADAANLIQKQTKANITVIPCGEQWEDYKLHEDTLRPAMEDYLGAGAVLSYLAGNKSPEAELCATSFLQAKQNINEFIWDCGSGRELREKGFDSDVTHCSRLNVYQTVPVLCRDHFIEYSNL